VPHWPSAIQATAAHDDENHENDENPIPIFRPMVKEGSFIDSKIQAGLGRAEKGFNLRD